MSALEKYLELDEQIKRLTAQKDELRKSIGELGVGPHAINDNYRLQVSVTRRFDPNLAKQLLTEKEFERILKSVPDVNLAKRTLSPESMDMLYKETGETWKVVERDD